MNMESDFKFKTTVKLKALFKRSYLFKTFLFPGTINTFVV